MRNSAIVAVAALALGAGAGYAAGRGRACAHPDASALKQHLAVTEQRLRDAIGARHDDASRRTKEAARAAGHDAPVDDACGGETEAFPLGHNLATVQELIAALEGMLGHKDLYRPDVVDFVESKLLAEIAKNHAALEWTIAKFKTAAGTDLAALLAIALGQVRDPAVESAALELARAGGDEKRRLAGLELLDRLDIENPQTRGAVVDMLRAENGATVTAAALYALHRGTPDPAETRDVVATLGPLAAHANAEVRRRAVIALAEWAPDASTVDSVVRALSDPSVDVRAGAAFALSRSRVSSPAAMDALVGRVADDKEDWAVREQAWRTLGRLALDARAHAAWSKFKAAYEEKNEAGDGAVHDARH
jgi:hypothetical protein